MRNYMQRFASRETVEVAETQASGILVKRPRLEEVVDWRVVPLAKGSRVVAIPGQDLCQGGSRLRDNSLVKPLPS